MRTFVAVAFACVAQAQVVQTIQNDLQIATGFVYGIGQQEHLDDLTNCMQHADIFAEEILLATQLII